MTDRMRLAVALAVAWLYVVGVLVGTALLVTADLAPAQQGELAAIARERGIAALIIATVLLVPAGFVLRALHRRHVGAALALSEHARVMVSGNASHRAPAAGSAGLRQLAGDLNDLAAAREKLQQDVEARIRDANARIEHERRQLAALMSELAQSVVVCNVEGRILLYNPRAMRLLSKPVEGAASGEPAPSLVGLGRSIFAVLDRSLIVHALETLQDRLQKGDAEPVAQFVTTAPAGQLVRVQMAPVMAAADGAGSEAAPAIGGFVLVLDDITRRIEAGQRRDLLLQTLTQGTRASLGSIRAAVETIASFPDMAADAHARFIGIIGDEARELTSRLDATVSEFADSLRTDWPLEDMRGADLVAAARRRIETRVALPTKLERIDEAVWIKADSYSLLQGITYLARRLTDEFGIREVRFNLEAAGALAHLDLVWTGAPLGSETTMAWQTDALEQGGEASPLTLRDIIVRHDAEIWYQIDKAAQREFFRIAVPLARPQEAVVRVPPLPGSRPEFYDFDLFRQAAQSVEQDAHPLAALAYTVFDTETTGLNPSQGDEIVSIGAVRIVNGRLLRHETFEQLVNPQREMSPEARAITGLSHELLARQPDIARVLPAFDAFCAETVLVAHNAAFDLRFLHLKEEATGIAFTQPVLDTLLLSAVLHPNLAANSLEAIAERLGVSPIGRHTALGDAIMTAEVFLRMLPLLSDRGIRTLGEARAASRATYLARLQY
jgi:DNA polymerase-3 subunit epsilon